MEMNTQVAVVCTVVALMLASPAQCFLTNRVTYPSLPADDFTLEDLTRETLLKVVAQYLEDTTPAAHSPGDLTNLNPLTASALLRAHYTAIGSPDCASSSNFESAINEIIEGNVNFANEKTAQSKFHFNAEQIIQGNLQMFSILNSLLSALASDTPMYSAVRNSIGQFLHMLQSFYSNTNWIESISNTDPYTELGYTDTLRYQTSPNDEWACKSCLSQVTNPKSPKELLCGTNLRSTTLLTSGYRNNQDIAKPQNTARSQGKCSHGGTYDSSWKAVPEGGINKDSTNSEISPHHNFHMDAAEVAIKAGVAFFNDPVKGILSQIGNLKFGKLFNLDSQSNALVLVIDDTGSMAEEIESVKASAIKLVEDTRNTCSAPSQYIVSPFNDPGVGPVTDTSDPEVAIEALRALSPHDGGDCPELCLTGIEEALNRVNFPSKVHVWTDADDKDSDKAVVVTALAKSKSASLQFILTGACDGFGRRKKRAISSTFMSLVEATGGTIYQTSNEEVATVSDIILAGAQSGVPVLQWNNIVSNVSILIPVDNTMQGLSVTITGPSSTRDLVSVFDPSGSQVPITDIIVDADFVFSFLLNSALTGSWKLKVNVSSNQYNVDVSTRSFVDFSYKILQEKSGVVVPVEGQPTADSDVVFQINVASSELLRSIAKVILHNFDGSQILAEATLLPVGGRTVGRFVAHGTIPSKPFSVSILGSDTDGHEIRRLRPGVVQVFNFQLERNDTLDDLIPGASEALQVTLVNLGSGDTFDIDATISPDDALISVGITPSAVALSSFEASSAVMTITASTDAMVGEVVIVTVTMTSRTTEEQNFFTTGLIVSQPLSIDEIPTPVDTSEPTCTIENITNECTLSMMNNDCRFHRWSTQVVLQDDLAIAEYNISDFADFAERKTNLDIPNSNTIILDYEANCCCPQVDFTIVDLVGNQQTCGLDYLTPVRDQISDVTQCTDICAYQVDVLNETDNWITFTWKPNFPRSTCSDDEFLIRYKLVSGDQCLEAAEKLKDTDLSWTRKTSATLSGLKPYSTYTIHVMTRQLEELDLPVVVTHNTAQAAPIGVPVNIKATMTEDTSVTLTWDDIPCGSRGGVIKYYKYHLKSPKGSHCTATGTTHERAYRIHDTVNCTSALQFRVAGVNEAGEGPFSDFIKISSIGSKVSSPYVLVYILLFIAFHKIK